MSVERYVATAGVTFTTDPDGPWVPYYRYAKLEAKCERLERERDDLREIGSRLVAAIDGALDDSAVAPLSVLMMVRAEMDAALEGREP